MTIGQTSDNLTEKLRLLMEQYEAPLIRYATRITGRLDIARDVVQDTFLKYITVQDLPTTPGRLSSWLFTVCRNRCLDVLRKEKRMSNLCDETFQLHSKELTPDDAASLGEESFQVLNALQQLPPNQREVIRLKFQNGFSYKQIAEITGHSVSNVGFLIHAGMQKLKSQFSQKGLI